MDEETKRAWLLVAAHDLHPGDKHPTKRGWVLSDELGPEGQPVFKRSFGQAVIWETWDFMKPIVTNYVVWLGLLGFILVVATEGLT